MSKAIDEGHIPGPTFIPLCASIRLIWLLNNGKYAHNVLHASYSAPPPVDQAFMNALFTAITTGTAWTGHAGNIATSVSLQQVGYRDMAELASAPGTGHAEFISSNGPAAGTGAGDVLPAQISFVVSLKTAYAGQANRGRVYLPGFVEAANAAGGVAGAGVGNAAVAFVQGVQAALGSRGLALCIAHPARKAYTGDANAAHPARSAGTVLVNSVIKLNDTWDSTRLRALR